MLDRVLNTPLSNYKSKMTRIIFKYINKLKIIWNHYYFKGLNRKLVYNQKQSIKTKQTSPSKTYEFYALTAVIVQPQESTNL